MSYVLAFGGFVALIVLHELGHFIAAKAVGMRVERFSLFFGPLLVRVRRGETEYGIGPIPFGGYVKISGMNPEERLPPEVVPRAYYSQPVWKRVVVILAGPAMNIVLAFLILWGVYLANGYGTNQVGITQIQRGSPAAAVLQRGDRLVAVDGVRNANRFPAIIASHGCARRPPTAGCVAAEPVSVTVLRDGHRLKLSIRPRYETSPRPAAMRIGISFGELFAARGPITAAGSSVGEMWHVTSATLSKFGEAFVSSKARQQIHGAVGTYDLTSSAFSFDISVAAFVLAVISLSLAIVNLFPFLPLDGGHIFWALVEKVRRRPVPVSVMTQASIVGIALIALIFAVGLSNDIHTLTNGGFHVR